MLIFLKTKDIKFLYKFKLQIRLFKQFLFHVFIIIKSKTKIIVIISFIINFFKKFKNENEYIYNIYNNFKFSSHDWFTMKIPILKYYLDKCVFPSEIRALEIGSFEGRSAIFFIKYFNKINLTCVDTWEGSDEEIQQVADFRKIEDNFDYNIKDFKDNITKYKDTSTNFFKSNISKDFDFIYIDGDHKYEALLNDANSSFKLLNKGGFMLFDDFNWFYYENIKLNPIYAINSFLLNKKKSVEIIFAHNQLLIKKK